MLEWTSLLPKTPVIELPNYLLKLHSVSNIKYKLYSFESDLKTSKHGTNPMEIRTQVLMLKIAFAVQGEVPFIELTLIEGIHP